MENPGNTTVVGSSGGVSCALSMGIFRRQSYRLQ